MYNICYSPPILLLSVYIMNISLFLFLCVKKKEMKSQTFLDNVKIRPCVDVLRTLFSKQQHGYWVVHVLIRVRILFTSPTRGQVLHSWNSPRSAVRN